MCIRCLLCHLTFFWLAARPQIFQEAIRVAPLALGGNEILTGRTLFVGCPLGARPVCSAESGAVVFFAFFVCSDPTDFSPSGSESAFRLPELTARFGGIVGTMYRARRDLKERQSGGRIDRARVAKAIQCSDGYATMRRVIGRVLALPWRQWPHTRNAIGWNIVNFFNNITPKFLFF